MRYLAAALKRDLAKKMVLLAGPRQCGKTTLAKALLDERGAYFNWDVARDRKVIRELAWPKDASLVVLDELHKAPKWKNLLKGTVDEHGNRPPLLVTGSARLDAFRRAGDALTGRSYFYRLHPIDVAESAAFLPAVPRAERVSRLLATGGFPEAFLNPADAPRLRNDRMEHVVREDLRDLSRVTSWRGPAELVELLRERVGKPTNYDNFWLMEVKAADTEVSVGLDYYTRKLRPKESLQLVLDLDRPLEKAGVKIVPLAGWLESLPLPLPLP